MAKVVIHILAAIGIGYCLYRTAKKALNEPPDEERYYTSYDAMDADGVEPGWDPEEWDPWVDGPRG